MLGKYLNTVPYGTVGGQSAIGAGAAARLYFDKRVQDLTLREAAMLAGMPQAPSTYSPVLNPSGTKQRRNEVLGKMAQLGYISRETAQKEMKKGLGLHMDALLPEGPRALRPRLRPVRADQGVRPQRRQARRLQGLHDDRPQEAEGGARRDRRQARRHRPVLGDRLDRPRQRQHRRDGVLAAVRQVEVQPRRPGPSPARLLVQDDGAADRAARGREPGLDELRVAARRWSSTTRRAALPPTRGRSRPTAAPGAAASTS